MLALVDVAPDRFYCVDFYRVSGGDNHWWAFHGQEGDFATDGLALTKQETGTLAGPDVPYGDARWMEANGCSFNSSYGWRGFNFVFPHLYNVQQGRATSPWSANWKLKTGDGLGLRLSVLRAASADGSPAEVSITDGKAASGGSPYEMKWIIMHNAGQAPAKTQVVSLIEPYLNDPLIRQATPVVLSGADESGFGAGACRVETADRTDTLFCASDPSIERTTDDGFRFAGRFGLWAEQDGQPVAISLVGGTVLQKGNLGIKLDSPEYRGKITKADRETETITVEPAPPAPEILVGQSLFIVNGARRIACKVIAVKETDGGAELSLYEDSCIGTGKVTGTQDFRVLTDTPFALHHFGYYEGARLTNAAGTADYRLNEVRSGAAALIDPEASPGADAATLAAEFPEGSWFKVYDFGVGDEVVWPYAVSVVKRSDAVYEVHAPVPVTLTLPDR
jgi:hypothetical protein